MQAIIGLLPKSNLAKPDLRDWVNCKSNFLVIAVVLLIGRAKPDLRDWVNCKMPQETMPKRGNI